MLYNYQQRVKHNFYQDSNVGPVVYFYLIYGAKTIDISISCETNDWKIQVHSEPQQVQCKHAALYTPTVHTPPYSFILYYNYVYIGEQSCSGGVYW